jgi:hypothetical protein
MGKPGRTWGQVTKARSAAVHQLARPPAKSLVKVAEGCRAKRKPSHTATSKTDHEEYPKSW